MIGVLWLSLFAVADPEGGGGDVRPLKKRERERAIFRPSIKHIEFLDTTDRGACCSVFRCHHASMVKNSKLANEHMQNN